MPAAGPPIGRDDGDAEESRYRPFSRRIVARFVDHVQTDEARHFELDELHHEIQIADELPGVDDDEREVGLP